MEANTAHDLPYLFLEIQESPARVCAPGQSKTSTVTPLLELIPHIPVLVFSSLGFNFEVLVCDGSCYKDWQTVEDSK